MLFLVLALRLRPGALLLTVNRSPEPRRGNRETSKLQRQLYTGMSDCLTAEDLMIFSVNVHDER